MPPRKTDNSPVRDAHDYGINLPQRELYIGGGLGYEGDEGMAFVKNLRFLQSTSQQPITVHMYSVGGDWCCGVTIKDAIAISTVPIILVCHGVVASMGTVIAAGCVGDGRLRLNMPNCDWLIHEGYSGGEDVTHRAAQSTAEWEERIRGDMMDSYAEAVSDGEYFSGMSPTKIKNYIARRLQEKHDWWLSSEDALYYGFVDGIIGSEEYPTVGDALRGM